MRAGGKAALFALLLCTAGCCRMEPEPRLVTVRETLEENGRDHISIRLPALTGTGNRMLEEQINRRIREAAEQTVADARRDVGEYRKVQQETGGKKEELIPLSLDINYQLHFSSPHRISFSVEQTHTLANAYTELLFFNLELPSGRELSLPELLGPDFRAIADAQIRRRIAERSRLGGEVFFAPDRGGFRTISDRQQFRLDEAGNVVIVFEKYEIAPGSMGIVEFTVVPEPQTTE